MVCGLELPVDGSIDVSWVIGEGVVVVSVEKSSVFNENNSVRGDICEDVSGNGAWSVVVSIVYSVVASSVVGVVGVNEYIVDTDEETLESVASVLSDVEDGWVDVTWVDIVFIAELVSLDSSDFNGVDAGVVENGSV